MSEKNPQPPARKSARKPTGENHKQRAPDKPARRSQSWPTLLAAIAVAISVALSIAGIAFWQQYNAAAKAASTERANTLSRLNELGTVMTQQSAALTNNLQTLRETELGMQASVQALHNDVGRNRRDWILAEARYYMELANQRLLLAADVNTAITALTLADKSLLSLGDPGLYKVREQVNADLNALKAVQSSDTTGMAITLGGLISTVDDLVLINRITRNKVTAPTNAVTDSATDTTTPGWLKHVAGVWEVIKQLVVVRRTDQPVVPLLPQEQKFFLYQNLRLELESARLSVLRRDAATFKASLATARSWLDQYFDKAAPENQTMKAALTELTKVNIAPELPDISGSLLALRKAMQGLEDNSKKKNTKTPAETGVNTPGMPASGEPVSGARPQ